MDSLFFHFIGFDIVGSSGEGSGTVGQFLQSELLKEILNECPLFQYAFSLGDEAFIKDLGDGLIIGYPKSIEHPIRLAMEFHKIINQRMEEEADIVPVRIGIYSGTVIAVNGFERQPDLRGSGIVGTNRVMSFGDNKHILLSDWVAEQLLELNTEYYGPFLHNIGTRASKGNKRYGLHNFYGESIGNSEEPAVPIINEVNLLDYYKSMDKSFVSFDGIKLPYIELWRSDVKEGLLENQICCYIAEEKFKPEDLLKGPSQQLYDWLKLNRRIGNRRVARLFDFTFSDGKLHLYFQETTYLYSLLTHFNIDTVLKNWADSLRNQIANAPLPPLNSSDNISSNHLGVNCVIETNDDPPLVFLQKRSSEVAVFSDQYGISVGAGLGFDAGNHTAGEKTIPSPFQELMLESINEIGIMPYELDSLNLLSLCRELETGGKPTTFFKGKTTLTYDEINRRFEEDNPLSRWETDYLTPIKIDDIQELLKIGKKDGIELSGPSKMNLLYYQQTL